MWTGGVSTLAATVHHTQTTADKYGRTYLPTGDLNRIARWLDRRHRPQRSWLELPFHAGDETRGQHQGCEPKSKLGECSHRYLSVSVVVAGQQRGGPPAFLLRQ